MANDENVENNRRLKVVVVGAGDIGLTAALAFVSDGHEVVIVARNTPGEQSTEWCSPQWAPSSGTYMFDRWTHRVKAGALLALYPEAELHKLQLRSLGVDQSFSRTPVPKSRPVSRTRQTSLTMLIRHQEIDITEHYDDRPGEYPPSGTKPMSKDVVDSGELSYHLGQPWGSTVLG